MPIRDDELKRLIQYARGLNASVSIRADFPGNSAAGSCTTDGREIIIYRSPKMSKIELIMTLTHEIGHLQYNIHNFNREPDASLEAALEQEEDKKRHRKVIYEYEKASAQWWDVIYKEVEMTFPFAWLERYRAFDVWQYEQWYLTGKWPTNKERLEKRKQLRRRYP